MKPNLRFRPDGSFLIAQFTDLHLTAGGEWDRKTVALIESILKEEKPDLAVLTGDVIAGAGNEGWDAASAWRLAVEPMERLGIPWAAVFGNHDDEGSHTRAELMEVQKSFPHCLSEPGPEDLPGVGNFVLNLSSESSPGARLYFLDSLAYGPKGVSEYAWISPEQIQWFRQRAKEAGKATGLAFFHIPVPEYEELWNRQLAVGVKHENVCCPKVNSGLFSAMLESGVISGVFVGHDHINDYEGSLHGIRLVYGRAGGYNSYGKEGFPRGARLIKLDESLSDFETWIRLEDGSRINRTLTLK